MDHARDVLTLGETQHRDFVRMAVRMDCQLCDQEIARVRRVVFEVDPDHRADASGRAPQAEQHHAFPRMKSEQGRNCGHQAAPAGEPDRSQIGSRHPATMKCDRQGGPENLAMCADPTIFAACGWTGA